ncbi:UNVERIFIED_CONTAM: Oleoyl-acyl carrier protein thioesterase, chloroplastic [Sesamum radiatum]|uniref:Acyl-[acyl-carrier-protein] hydrolase n=1 Tax=Sesamum radiatum TaxID=300843 RepID=A0AAW2W563_SESRA
MLLRGGANWELPVFRLDSIAKIEGHATQHQGQGNCRFSGLIRRPTGRVATGCSRARSAAGGIGGHGRAEKQATGVELPEPGFRLGSLNEDGLSYKEKFIVRCYEVGINKTATVETIAYCRSDVVEIETWCQSEGRIGTRRDWILKDYATGEVIGRATSKWVMMNQDTRRLQKVTDEVRDEYLVFCPKTLRLAFPEENNASLKKISKLDDPAEYSKVGLVPRRADLDMNQHVNNVTYIGWVLESMPQEIIDSYELQTITLDYRRECQHDDVVDSPLLN